MSVWISIYQILDHFYKLFLKVISLLNYSEESLCDSNQINNYAFVIVGVHSLTQKRMGSRRL